MKLKVAIVDKDVNYMNRLQKNFQLKYANKINIYVFSDIEKFYQSLKEVYVDVLLMDSSIKVEAGKLPEGMALGYLCDMADAEEIDGLPAVCRFQKMDTVYKLILGIYAENSSNIKMKKKGSLVRTTLFTSVQGGSGTSSAAAAYAIRRASKNKKVFYLNLEKFGRTDWYFTSDGAMSFSDVIYSLKSRKSNLMIKLESATRTDVLGIDFFAPCRNAYDMLELKDNEVSDLLRGISQAKAYDEIVIDLSGDLTERMLLLMKEYADIIIYVCDGSMTGNGKFKRFCEVIRVIEQRDEVNILGKTNLLYNRYSSKGSTQLDKTPVAVMGGIHRFEGVAGRALAEQIAQTEVFASV